MAKKKTQKINMSALASDPLNAAVRTDTAAAMRKLSLLGRICVAYELIARNTQGGDEDAFAVLELREILGRLIEMNHVAGYRRAKISLGKLKAVPGGATAGVLARRKNSGAGATANRMGRTRH